MDMEAMRKEMLKKKVAPLGMRTITLHQHWDELRHKQLVNDVLSNYL